MINGGAFHSYGTVYQRAPWLTDQRAAAALVRTRQVEHPGHLLGSPDVSEPALVEEGHNGLRAAYLRRCHPSLRFTRSA